ncbi:hypothetical protein F4677DRAFT_36338 [Hypoxylon crocopeplum]|nr:hypothetical protein F4677DRAFT_36338 [Hypoxylon crocopeplum]
MEPAKTDLLSIISPAKSRKSTPGLANGISTQYTQWYLRYLDFQFRQLSEREKHVLWGIQGNNNVQDAFYKTVAFVASQITTVNRPSLQSIATALLKENGLQTTGDNIINKIPPVVTKDDLATLIFRVIGWLTMFLEIEPSQSHGSQFCVREPTDTNGTAVDSEVFETYIQPPDELARLPIHQLVKRFSQHIIPSSWLTSDFSFRALPGDPFSEQLVVSYLNFRALHKVAAIELEFVPYLGMHLEFDEESRRLKLFQFPSWCMILATSLSSRRHRRRSTGSDPRPYLASFLENYFESRASEGKLEEYKANELGIANLCGEVLLSYRMIFGQDRKSAGTFNTIYKGHLDSTDGSETPSDSLLREVCGRYWKDVLIFQDIELAREKTQYSASKDFPFFRDRLVTLQRFVVEQDPNDLKTLLHDRRDILRYWTFWGVIYIGGLSIFLSIIQSIIGILQIVLK